MSKTLIPETILYEDEFTTVTNKNIKLEWYYFPTAGTKVIDINDIEDIKYEKNGTFKSKAWGMPLSNRWFGCDMQRHSRDWVCVLDVKDQWTNPACTPLRIGEFRRALDVAQQKNTTKTENNFEKKENFSQKTELQANA